MKLRNKKTGEIKEIQPFVIGGYGSLAELNEKWEDYEEPKEHYWLIDEDGTLICRTVGDFTNEEMCKQIGNYFESRGEAKKTVEKLKAWERLKDARFEFGTIKYNLDEESSSTIAYDGVITFKGIAYEDFVDDLNICFGGEE